MITLTRLNGQSFVLNACYIEQIQAYPDTTITLTNGKKIVVLEPVEDVMIQAKDFFKDVSLLGMKKEVEGK